MKFYTAALLGIYNLMRGGGLREGFDRGVGLKKGSVFFESVDKDSFVNYAITPWRSEN